MKKMLALLLTLCLLAGLVPLGAGAEEDTNCEGSGACDHVAAIGDKHYNTLAEAVEAVQDSTATTIKLLKNVDNGDGIIIPEDKNITIDFATYTYTVTQNLAGSSGSENQCFQLLENSTVVLKNGAIVGNNNSIKMMVQNYSNLTLESMSLDATKGTNSISYVSSNNCGKVFVTGNTTITAKGTGKAFDVSYWPSAYPDGTQVEINTTGTITGDIEIGLYGANGSITLPSQSVLSVKNVNLVGNITTLNTTSGQYDTGLSDEDAKKAFADKMTISGGTFSSDVSQYTEEGYTTVQKDGKYVVEKLDATNAVAMAGEKYFKSLSDAFSGAEDATTIYLLQNTMHNERIDVQKNATLNLGGHTLISETSHSFVVSPDIDFTIQNGTIQNKTGTVAYALKGSIITLDSDATLECKDGICSTNNTENEGGATFNVYGKIHSTDIAVWGRGIGNTVNIEGAELTANYFTVYQNGSYGGNTYTIKNSTIYNGKDGSAAIYISNSKKNSENKEQGFQTLTVENSKITGETGIEVKYTNVTIKGEDTEVIATGTPPDTTLNNNGSVTTGYAFASTHNGTNSSADGAGGTITIEGGAFSGLIGLQQPTGQATTTASFSISGGYFTSDPSEYVATGYYAGESDNAAYAYQVKENENEESQPAEVVAAEPAVKASGITDKDDVEKVAAALAGTEATLDAAAKEQAAKNTVDTTAAKEALEEAKITVNDTDNVTVVVQPYLAMEAKSYDSTNSTMTVDIKAMYRTVATTADLDNGGTIYVQGDKGVGVGDKTANAVVIGKKENTLPVKGSVEISIPLPDGFVTTDTTPIYVQHENIYEYQADVTSETGDDSTTTYTATFTNPHGFSTFVLSTESETVATVNDTDYTNFQQAVNAAGTSIIEVKADDQIANSVTHSLTLKNSDPDKAITVTINGEKIKIPAGGTETFTYTAPTPPRPTEEKHSITISTDGKGQVTGPASAAEDDKVTLTVKPNADKELYDLKVTDEDGKAIAVTKVNDTTYTFTMPDGKVTVAATFGCDGGDNCPSKAFTDLGDKQWYHDSIDYAVENGLLEGTSPTTMEPNATLIRAQLAQILYNIEDKPAVTGEMVFEDVPASEWFYSPILWANQNDIINGTSPTTFEPLENISRQDLALMLYRYAGEPAVTGDLDGFTDADQVGDWAEEAMAWAVAEGIVQGDTPTTLNPTGTATRAEAAAMLQRFLEDAA